MVKPVRVRERSDVKAEPAQTHNQVVKDITEYLEYIGWKVHKTHNGRNHPVDPGVPDLIALGREGYLPIEVKIGEDIIRPKQIEWARDHTERTGHHVLYARSSSDIRDYLDDLRRSKRTRSLAS